MSLDGLLRQAGITKTELAKRLGVHKATITNWKHQPPQYAVAYCELLVQYNAVASVDSALVERFAERLEAVMVKRLHKSSRVRQAVKEILGNHP